MNGGPDPDLDPVAPVEGGEVVALDGVRLSYGDVDALDGVSLTVRAGERVALVGPSGAGKSSLLSLFNTGTPPSQGTVRLFGVDPVALGNRQRRAVRSRIGTVHQDLHLPGPLRVVHNVNAGRLGRWSTTRALRSLVRPVGVDDVRAALDRFGMADMVWRRTDELSGGERQRVALARLLVQGAELILADEPIASLDPARAREVLTALCSMTALDAVHPRTLVVSLHAFDLAVEYFDRVIGLRHGRLVFDLPSERVTEAIGAQLYDLSALR